MTTAFILAALFLPLVGFIAGALWERRKNETNDVDATNKALAENQILRNENEFLRHWLDLDGELGVSKRVGP